MYTEEGTTVLCHSGWDDENFHCNVISEVYDLLESKKILLYNDLICKLILIYTFLFTNKLFAVIYSKTG